MSAEVEAAHAAAEAVEASGGIAALGINAKLFIAQLVHFLIVLLIFWKWVYAPVVKLLDERAKTIEKSIDDAKLVEERVAKLEDERKDVITEAKREALTIIEEARSDADKRKQEMLEKAKSEVEKVVADGKVALTKEKEKMIRDAKKDIAGIAVEATRKILEETVDEAKSQKLAESAVEKLT